MDLVTLAMTMTMTLQKRRKAKQMTILVILETLQKRPPQLRQKYKAMMKMVSVTLEMIKKL